VISDALAAACTDDDVLARIGGPLGIAARAKATALRRMPEAPRKQARALAAAIAHAPTLAGLRGIHGSWIEAALGELPVRARRDFATGGGDPTGVWLARWAAAALAPMPVADLARPSTIHDVARLTGDALVEWLFDVGADQLAFALGTGVQQLTGDRLAAAADRITRAPREGRLGTRKAAITRCKVDLVDDGLLRIGARAVAPHTDACLRRQIALRLPRTRGLVVLFELQQFAAVPLEASPTWEAIAHVG
jgi:hypothetical protein